jgi:ribonuclease HI
MSGVIQIFTDGSARGNPGPGGYGIILRFRDNYKEISQGFRMTTNNRMELLAVIVALESLKTKTHPIVVHSDSKYVIDAITKGWLQNWVRIGFKKKKNQDLWMRYLRACAGFQIQFQWVKGHAGHPENERCDVLAVEAALGKDLDVDEYFENHQQQELLD